ncbi:dicarboxylate transporter/tellurite-resistance protein TehA, partial [Salmonella enterica subsp. enterica]
VPAAFFGMVLGLAGLGGIWRLGARLWGLPPIIGEVVMLIAAVVWLVVAVLYAAKWVRSADAARAEAGHPVQCCFIGLAGVATMLVGLGALPYS